LGTFFKKATEIVIANKGMVTLTGNTTLKKSRSQNRRPKCSWGKTVIEDIKVVLNSDKTDS
jgi:ATP-dependent protease HslVU (ClpYQ) peptidase subunit